MIEYNEVRFIQINLQKIALLMQAGQKPLIPFLFVPHLLVAFPRNGRGTALEHSYLVSFCPASIAAGYLNLQLENLTATYPGDLAILVKKPVVLIA